MLRSHVHWYTYVMNKLQSLNVPSRLHRPYADHHVTLISLAGILAVCVFLASDQIAYLSVFHLLARFFVCNIFNLI